MSSSSSSSEYDESNNNKEEVVSLYFIFFSGLLAFVIFLSKKLHDIPWLNTFVSEAALVLIIGMIAGFIVHNLFLFNNNNNNNNDDDDDNVNNNDNDNEQHAVDFAHTMLSFDSHIFFLGLLPPIMFHSGYELRRELFYRHIRPIIMFACLGTIISGISTGCLLCGIRAMGWMPSMNFDPPQVIELMTFGVLIAATDTVSVLAVFQKKRVDPHLFALVFGESALNDAVALVLFKTLSEFLIARAAQATAVNNENENENDEETTTTNTSILHLILLFLFDFAFEAIGSPILGMMIGIVVALVFKHTDLRQHPMFELPLYILLMYIPFLAAEFLHMSGIVTIFFTGIAARRYVSPNVSMETCKVAEIIFKLAAYIAETSIFLELGLSVFALFRSSYYWDFILYSFISALLGRAISMYPLSFVYNWSLREFPHDDDEFDDDYDDYDYEYDDEYDEYDDNNWNDKNHNNNKNEKSNGENYDDDKYTDYNTDDNDDNDKIKNGSSSSSSSIPMALQQQQQQQQRWTTSAVTGERTPSSSAVIAPLPKTTPPTTPTTTTTTTLSSRARQRQQQHGVRGPKMFQLRRRRTPQRRKDKKISWNMTHTMWFSGLRGAVAYSCARDFPNIYGHTDEFVAATAVIVLTTIIIMGGMTEYFLQWMNIDMNVDEDIYMINWYATEQIIGQKKLKGTFHHFEQEYIYEFAVRSNSSSSSTTKMNDDENENNNNDKNHNNHNNDKNHNNDHNDPTTTTNKKKKKTSNNSSNTKGFRRSLNKNKNKNIKKVASNNNNNNDNDMDAFAYQKEDDDDEEQQQQQEQEQEKKQQQQQQQQTTDASPRRSSFKNFLKLNKGRRSRERSSSVPRSSSNNNRERSHTPNTTRTTRTTTPQPLRTSTPLSFLRRGGGSTDNNDDGGR